MMSIFAVNFTSCLSCDVFALFTMWQSEHGCAPSNVRFIASQNEVSFAFCTIIAVQAIDWSAIH